MNIYDIHEEKRQRLFVLFGRFPCNSFSNCVLSAAPCSACTLAYLKEEAFFHMNLNNIERKNAKE